MKAWHLVNRFVRALWPGRPSVAARAWLTRVLSPSELALFTRMPNHDQRHAIGVARRVEGLLAGTEYAGDDRWLAAALLHDIGKIDAHLSVFGRVAATMAGLSMSREAAADWSRGRGFRRRIGLYLRHPEVGADRIAIIGGQPVAVTWARVHHDRFAWSTTDLPEPVIAALDAADND